MIFLFGDWVAEKLKLHQETVIVTLCLLLAAIMVVFDIRILGFQFIAYYFIIYSAGYYLHKYHGKVVTNNHWLLAALAIVWGFLAWFWNMHSLPVFLQGIPVPATLAQYAYRFVTALIAIYLLFAVSPKLLDSGKGWNKPFVSMGGISLGIYTTHFILIGRIIEGYRIVGLNEFFLIVCSFVSALLVSWLIVWLLSKWKVTATWMLGKV